MAEKPRLSYMLSRSKSNETATRDLYAQLQSPAQRAAISEAMNAGAAGSKPESKLLRQSSIDDSVPGSPKIVWTTTRAVTNPATYKSYDDAVADAGRAAYSKTIDPRELVRGVGRTVQPSNLSNAYLNPVAEGAYETNPQFNLLGQQVAGYGSSSTTPSRTVLDDLAHGETAQRALYNEAVSDSQANASYATAQAQKAAEARRLSARVTTLAATSQSVPRYFDNARMAAEQKAYNDQQDARNAAFNRQNQALANSALAMQGNLAARQSNYFTPMSSAAGYRL